jgi:hypothetical protein
MILDVTGTLNATLGLPASEAFSIASVAAGTYTIALRASNVQGPSAASNSVTVTIPGPCSGVPGTPENFTVSKNGLLITATWSLPTGGAAPTSYRLFVSGAFTGELAVTERRITGAVGAGTYTVSVAATNACGSGVASAPQTVAIP